MHDALASTHRFSSKELPITAVVKELQILLKCWEMFFAPSTSSMEFGLPVYLPEARENRTTFQGGGVRVQNLFYPRFSNGLSSVATFFEDKSPVVKGRDVQ